MKPRKVTSKPVPQYRFHRARSCAVVTLNGRNHYLGEWQSPASLEKYARLLSQWQRGELEAPEPAGGPTVGSLALRYMEHAARYYVKDGKPTNQVSVCKAALRHCCELWASLPVAEFSPLKLQAVIARMVEHGCSRTYANKLLVCIKIAFKWGVAQEIVPPAVLQGLQAVSGLRRGRTTARENPPVGPVAPEIVEATARECSPIVATMIELGRLTGMRIGEVCGMRPRDVTIEPGGTAVYIPPSHKTAHHGKERKIILGPRALAALKPYLARPPEMNCFRPVEAVEWKREQAAAARKTPPVCKSHATQPIEAKGEPEANPGRMLRCVQRAACDNPGGSASISPPGRLAPGGTRGLEREASLALPPVAAPVGDGSPGGCRD